MKSPMVQRAAFVADKSGYGAMEVLRSAAGYYLGTLWTERDPATGETLYQSPGSRDSGYYNDRGQAEDALRLMTCLGDETAAAVLRQSP